MTIAVAQDKADVLALSFRYGQRHSREIECAKAVAAHYKVDHLQLDLPPEIFRGSGSGLVDQFAGAQIPDATYEELAKQGGVDGTGRSPTYVPFRNATLISIATAQALTYHADEVWIAAHSDDFTGNAYPDTSPETIN